MSLASIRKKGYLFKLPVKGLVKKWSKRWFVLHATSHEGVVRIEYFDTADYEVTGVGKRTIPLRDVSGLAQITGNKIQPYIFQFNSQIGYHVFASESQTDLDEWIEGIHEAVREDRMRMRKKKTQSLVITSGDEDFKEERDTVHRKVSAGTTYIHEPSNAGTYRVTLEQNETTERLNLSGTYNLEITPNNILLISPNSGATLIIWQYRHLKNYGKMHGRCHFETGRGAQCGVGNFVFVTTCSKEIFGIIHHNIKKLRSEKELKQKQALEEQVTEAVVAASKVPKHGQTTKPVSKQVKIEKRPRPRSKASEQDVAGHTTVGTYRSSRNLDDRSSQNLEDQSHVYDLVAPDEDPSDLYTKVKKKVAHPNASGPPLKPTPYATNHTDNTIQNASLASAAAKRSSYGNTRDSRDSALMEQDGSFLNPLAKEEEHEDDVSPLMSPINNPFRQAVGTDVSFNMDQFDDNLFATLDQIDLNDTTPAYAAPFQQPLIPDPWAGQPAPSYGLPNAGVPNRQLNQQELDNIWESISSTIADTQQF